MKKSFKMVAAATLLGVTMSQTVAHALSLEEMIPANWVKRSVEHIRESIASSEDQYYVVQWGDTLANIAAALDVPVHTLVGLNGIQNPDLIISGSVIYYNAARQTVTYDDRQGHVETVSTETHEPVATEAVPNEVLTAAAEQSQLVDLSPVTQVEGTQAQTTEAPAVAETPQPVAPVEQPVQEAQAPVQEAAPVQTPASATQPAAVESEVVSTTPAAPVAEEMPAAEVSTPVAETPAVEEAPAATNTGSYVGVQSAAKEWIANKESGGSYDAVNPSGKYIGRYQLSVEYLNGDHSVENQERVADEYVRNRYGTWEAAKAFWEANGWY